MDILQAPRWNFIAGLLLSTGMAAAQGVPYKVIGPDGKVTYTDRPAADARTVRPMGAAAAPDSAVNPMEALPLALRQTAQRYPVTLYTAPGCAPCDLGRVALQQRGVPYREWRVEPGGVAELQRREGTASLPVLRVGTQQQLVGFEAVEWRRTLDAAGYPASSALPPRWQAPPVQALKGAEVKAAEAPAGASEAARPAAPQPVAPGGGGFRF
jgi:glutaredoxin